MIKKLIYIANIRLPTERAHGIQIVKTCEALADKGVEVELVISNRHTHINESVFNYYNAKDDFKITKIWCLDTVKYGWLGFWIESITFGVGIIWPSLNKWGTFYTRDEFVVFLLKILGKEVVWEAHTGQKNVFVRFIILFNIKIVAISNGLRDLYISLGANPQSVAVIPDGVDLDQFDLKISKEEARRKLGIDLDKKLVVYTGSKISWKGTEILKEAAKLLSNDIEVLIVTGKPYAEIPIYLKAADLLVLPNTAKDEISRLYTSPMKLFEYMASGTPIIASKVDSICEVVDEKAVYFFKPDDVKDLINIILNTLSDYNDSAERGNVARAMSEEYSWQNRARGILKFITNGKP